MSTENNASELMRLTVDIVTAHVARNNVPMTELVSLIQQIHKTLAAIGTDSAPVPEDKPQPAVPIKRSVFPDYIVCLEDGKKLKMLKRHLKTAFGLSPEQYRERWGLAHDYPMVAPNYARQRSKLAKEIGLGTAARRKRD